MNRDRPRMNITLDPAVKERIQSAASRLNVTASRLIEEVTRRFLEDYDDNPTLGIEVKRAIEQTKVEDDPEKREQADIDAILHEFDSE